MGATWTPDNSSPLLEATEADKNVSASLTVDPGAGGSVELSAAYPEGPLPPQVEIAISGGTLALSAPDLAGLFPFVVKFIRDGDPDRKVVAQDTWAGIDFGSVDVVAMLPFPASFKDFPIDVRAAGVAVGPSTPADPVAGTPETPGPQEPFDETKRYILRVYANFTANAETLKRAVAARRRSAGK